MRRFLAVTLAATAFAVVVPTLGASAGPPDELLDVELVSQTEPLTFSAFVDDDVDCDSVAVVEVTADGNPVEPLAVVPDDLNSNLVYIVLPSDTPAGELFVAVECLDGEQPLDYEGDFTFAALAVTKTVDGSVPEGAAFVVKVDCVAGRPTGAEFLAPKGLSEDMVFELSYGSAGGTKYVYFGDPADCVITEPVNGGATATTITPDEVIIDNPETFTATVVNTFAAAVEPTFTG